MHLEYHRGGKTTQLEIKHYNRRAELWAQAAETLVTMVDLYQPNVSAYDKPGMFEMWRKILFNQFHDILPGSSIPDVYLLAVKEQKDAIGYAQQRIRAILTGVKPAADEVVIYNPFNWSRSEYVTVPTESGTNLYYCENIPPLSLTTMKMGANREEPQKWHTILETDASFLLENSTVVAEIQKRTGALISLLYKPLQYEFIDPSKSRQNVGCGLRVYRDIGKAFPAWNINRQYWKKPIPVRLVGTPQLTQRPDGISQITVQYGFLTSTATIQFHVRPKDTMLRINIHTDIKDPEILVKYFLPLNLKSEEVTAEIPYASIVRKRKMRTEMEKGKWECPMQKWIDISDKDVGLTILNNNRYGYSASMHGVYITLTRTPKYPTPGFYSTHRTIPKAQRPKYTDLKPFDYALALVPHPKGWQETNNVS